jgi:hypothetical protein
LDTVSVVSFTVSLTVLVTLSVVSLTVSEALPELSWAELDDEGEADGVGLELSLAEEPLPPVRTPVIASPMVSRTLPLLADAEGVGVEAAWSEDFCDVLAEDEEADGVGSALSSEPESDEEVLPESELAESEVSEVSEADADGVASSFDESADSLALVDGEAEAEALAVESARAATQSLYSSAVRLFDDGEVVEPLSARAREDVKPIPMMTAVGIATVAIALPAGMWNLVNSGFLGAACRGPVLTRDSSTSAPWVPSSAGTVPPVRPVRRARS